YDIDRVISRTFVYGALTAILAGLYAASIKLFTSFFVDVTRQSSDTALVLTTLVLATTFTPIKGWLEGVAASWFRPTAGAVAEGSAAPSAAAVVGAPAGGASNQEIAVSLGLVPDADLDAHIAAIAETVVRRVLDEQRAQDKSAK